MDQVVTAGTIRQRIDAAGRGVRRLKRVDRAASVLITLGGVGIVASVLGILGFIVSEAWPLFVPARSRPAESVVLPGGSAAGGSADRPLVLGVDEYQTHVYDVRADGRLRVVKIADRTLTEMPIPGLAVETTVTAASRTPQGDFLAAGTADGRVALLQVRFRPRYENERLKDVDVDVQGRGVVAVDPGKRPVRELSYRESPEGAKSIAAAVSDHEIAYWHAADSGEETRAMLRTEEGDVLTRVRLGRGDVLAAGTTTGRVYHWEAGTEPRLTDVVQVGFRPVTALEWVLGISFVVGDSSGDVSAWFRARLRDEDEHQTLLRAHRFPSQGSAIQAIGVSSRDKSFLTAGADGSLVLRHMTSERSVLSLPATGVPAGPVLITPKSDAVLAAQPDGTVRRYEIANPHPEITWKALLGKVWYEGYSQPEYVWQSTGATDDFETKFSLVPLAFGTIKGTVYALLFAVPLAVLGALYTSQFVHPSIRAKVKPTVEIMAALPSVVIGFIAGLWLAALVERHVVAVLLMLVVLPLAGTAGVLLWRRLPGAARRVRPGMELTLIVPLLLAGGWLATVLAPGAEAGLFGGDFRLWLKSTLDLTYDPRNCLVVGLAMGFAVIPIIFTISEDAFSSVPSSLTAGSLALGASRWQTALRVVLPTASPGVFSAVMIGFGRAVGETMIVLMATGNTPVLDWSIFNGMRTLSANIAVEIPEAPHGGTLYRVLFLAAALLFAMTFLVNTVAELIRQRLRERYRAL
jgi:phosphate transport system permease protein